MENSRRSERFLGCRAVRGFYCKLGVGPLLGGGEGPMSKWSRTLIIQKQNFACKIVTQMLSNIRVQKSASSDTRTGGFFILLC